MKNDLDEKVFKDYCKTIALNLDLEYITNFGGEW